MHGLTEYALSLSLPHTYTKTIGSENNKTSGRANIGICILEFNEVLGRLFIIAGRDSVIGVKLCLVDLSMISYMDDTYKENWTLSRY